MNEMNNKNNVEEIQPAQEESIEPVQAPEPSINQLKAQVVEITDKTRALAEWRT